MSPAVDLRRVGREAQPLAVIDGLHPDPEGLRAAAAAASFGQAAHAYPGLRAALPDGYMSAVLPVVARLAANAFGGGAPEPIDASFSIVATPPAELEVRQRLPHCDAFGADRLALVHYLASDGEGGGTGFFRHRSTGWESIDEERSPIYLGQLDAELRHLGVPAAAYPAGSDRLFELTEAAEPRFNRALVYPGHVLHSGLIPAGITPPPDPRTGRLTVTAFFKLRRAS